MPEPPRAARRAGSPGTGESSLNQRPNLRFREDRHETAKKQLILARQDTINNTRNSTRAGAGDNRSPMYKHREYRRGTSSLVEIPYRQNIDGFWDPHNAVDVIVHLKMSFQEDLDEILEEFSRLRRLGDFASARSFFAEHLHDHLHMPYVLVEYAEMLLEQGDYNTFSEIDDKTMYNAGGNIMDNHYGDLLRSYWELILVFVSWHKPHSSSERFTEIINSALNKLVDMVGHMEDNEKGNLYLTDITSTEIKMLALFYNLVTHPKQLLFRRLSVIFPSTFYRVLYTTLLSQGRIWDLHDIAVTRAFTPQVDVSYDWSDDPDFRRRIQDFIKDWSNTLREPDTSTTLALLGVLMSLGQRAVFNPFDDDVDSKGRAEIILDLSAPLALSIIENDPRSMRSRSFIKWMLMKPFIAGQDCVVSQIWSLRLSQGIALQSNHFQLPLYIPMMSENPGWDPVRVTPDHEGLVSMALNMSRCLADYQTEGMSLRELTKLSTNSIEVFEELGKLEKLTQGDIHYYSNTLISKYLVSDTEHRRNKLKDDLAELLSIPFLPICLDSIQMWSLNILLYTLEKSGPAAVGALNEAGRIYTETSHIFAEAFWEDVIHKIPAMKRFARRIGDDSVEPRHVESGLRHREHRPSSGVDRRSSEDGISGKHTTSRSKLGKDRGIITKIDHCPPKPPRSTRIRYQEPLTVKETHTRVLEERGDNDEQSGTETAPKKASLENFEETPRTKESSDDPKMTTAVAGGDYVDDRIVIWHPPTEPN
ncbi:hypothetical protein F5Y04DRAFT_292820 [Hypomontagnella monticulosa]|nr:hypothetical protein F5Y04DRAFT_292820 [Hypomontagnella monticulosa]